MGATMDKEIVHGEGEVGYSINYTDNLLLNYIIDLYKKLLNKQTNLILIIFTYS